MEDQFNQLDRPATTPEAREQQMIALAVDVAEQQMRSGKVSPAVLTHYLRLATEREKKERLKLDLENKRLESQIEQIGSQIKAEELLQNAEKVFGIYSGNPTDTYEDVDDYER